MVVKNHENRIVFIDDKYIIIGSCNIEKVGRYQAILYQLTDRHPSIDENIIN